MNRYIDAETIPDMFNEKFKETQKLIEAGETQLDNLAEGFTKAEKIVLFKVPTADVQEVKHGKWIRDDDQDGFRCSNCGHATNETLPKWYQEINGDTCNICYRSAKPFYCSRCGAKMDLEEE